MKSTSFWKIVWGLLFIASAGLIILNLFGISGGLSIWTLLLSIPLAAGAIAFAIKMQWFGMFLLLGALTFVHRDFLIPLVGLEEDFNLNFWAVMGVAALLGIGFQILLPKKNIFSKSDFKNYDGSKNQFSATIEHADGEKLYFSESFTGASKYINSDNLSYVAIANSFGGMEIYFQNANLAPEGAIVEIDNKFGGVELYIPIAWNIVNNISNFAGAADIGLERAYNEGAPTIILRGDNKFGGIDVRRV